jgi:hypothetical protein
VIDGGVGKDAVRLARPSLAAFGRPARPRNGIDDDGSAHRAVAGAGT